MKKCSKCGEIQSLHAFPKSKNSKDGYAGRCKMCQRELSRQHYKSNKHKYNKSRDKTRERNKQIIWDAKSVPCADCGVQYDPWIMQFDHLPQYEKEFNISAATTHSLKRLMAEIAKCEVVCANCHVNRTYQRRNMARA